MSTGDKRINMYPKKVAPEDQIREGWLEYTLSLISDNLKALYPSSGFFSAPTVAAGSVEDTFEISSFTGLYAGDVGRYFDYAGGDEIPFENANTVEYWAAVHLALVPVLDATGLEGSPDFATFRYSQLEEMVGYFVEPDSVVDTGSGVKFYLNDVLTGNVGSGAFDQSGREVYVMLWPDPESLDPAEAFQLKTVAWDTSDNTVTTTNYLGATGIKAASFYRVFVPVCTVSKSSPSNPALWTVKITGNGPTAFPSAFDYSGQNILGFSPATITAAFQREHVLSGSADDGRHKDVTFGTMRNRTTAEGGSAGNKFYLRSVNSGDDANELFRVLNNAGSTVVKIKGSGETTIEEDFYLNGDFVQFLGNGENHSISGIGSQRIQPMPFLDFRSYSESPDGNAKGVSLVVSGSTYSTPRLMLHLVPYHQGSDFPSDMVCTVHDTGLVDVSGAADFTADPVLPLLSTDSFVVRIDGTTNRDGIYSAEVIDADTLDVHELDESSVSWSGGDQAGTITLYTIKTTIASYETGGGGLDVGFRTSSYDPGSVGLGYMAVDNPAPVGGNEVFGYGFAHVDVARDEIVFATESGGAARGWAFGGRDNSPVDPADTTGPKERYIGLDALGYSAEVDDVLLMTGEENGDGRVYIGRPEEDSANWPFLQLTEPFLVLDVDSGSILWTDLRPWATGQDLGTSSYRWDVFVEDFDINGDVTGDLVPVASYQNLGDASHVWNLYCANLFGDAGAVTVGAHFEPLASSTYNLGHSSRPWAYVYGWRYNMSGDVASPNQGGWTSHNFPNLDDTYDLGRPVGTGAGTRWRDLHCMTGTFYETPGTLAIDCRGDADIDGDLDVGGDTVLKGDVTLGFAIGDDVEVHAGELKPLSSESRWLGRAHTNNGGITLALWDILASRSWWVAERMHVGSDYDRFGPWTPGDDPDGGIDVEYLVNPAEGNAPGGAWGFSSVPDWTLGASETDEVLFFPMGDLPHGAILRSFEGRSYTDGTLSKFDVEFGYWSGDQSNGWAWTSVQTLDVAAIGTGNQNWSTGSTEPNDPIDLSQTPRRQYGFRVIATTGVGQSAKILSLALDLKVDQADPFPGFADYSTGANPS